MDLANNEVSAEMNLSPDAILTDLVDKDSSVEAVLYVHEIFRPQEVGRVKKYNLFKFTLAAVTKKITCLIWGMELIEKYQNQITANKKLYIDGAFCKATILTSAKIAENFVPFELIIQKVTIIQYVGFHGKQALGEVTPTTTSFNDVHHANGLITIKGFIKIKFVAATNRFDNATYGSGSITDGDLKINVNITNYSPITFEKGTAVIVTGVVNDKTGYVSITCTDSSKIQLDPDVTTRMPINVLINVLKTPKRECPAE